MSVPTVKPRLYLEAPVVPVPRGGLLDVATVTEMSDPHLALAGVEYITGPCGVDGLAPGLCFPDSGIPVDPTKTIDPLEIVEGEPFGVYRRVGCTVLGEPYEQHAQDSFERGEPYAVEKAFYYSWLQNATVIDGGDVPQSAAAAVGALEQALAESYGGAGVILTSRQGAVVLGSQQVVFPGMDSPLTTILGTRVGALSFGTAGPDGAAAPDGSFWVYAMGHVNLWKGSTFTSDPVRDTSTNESTVLVERVWSATVECEIFAALVSLCPCSDCTDGSELPTVTRPAITSPADGATVPAVHDVLGTARPGSTIELWHSEPDGSGDWTSYSYTGVSTITDADGNFAFTGDHAAVDPVLRWRVRTSLGVWSDPVEINVEAA